MDILQKIVIEKQREVIAKKSLFSIGFLKESPLFNRNTYSLSNNVKEGNGIIAEFKRRSPSRQLINGTSKVHDVVKGYQQAGVSGVSVLTDTSFFGGSLEDLLQARSTLSIPVLRKEFIINAYQIYEAKAYGADAILLITAILTEREIKAFSELAHQLNLEVLLEIHNNEELKKASLQHIDLVGVNNRNLKTFEVSIDNSKRLSHFISDKSDKVVKISESGINSIATINELKKYGYQGFLMGEHFMKTDNPSLEIVDFIKKL